MQSIRNVTVIKGFNKTRYIFFLLLFPTKRRIQSNILMPFQFIFNANQVITLITYFPIRLSSNSYYLRYFHVFYDHFSYSLEFNHLLYNQEQQNYTIRYFLLHIYFLQSEWVLFIYSMLQNWLQNVSNSKNMYFNGPKFKFISMLSVKMYNLNLIWCWIDQRAVSAAFQNNWINDCSINPIGSNSS